MKVSPSPSLTFETHDFYNPSPEKVELIEKLLAISTALSSTHELGELLNLILFKMREITWSDAGSVYLINKSDAIPKLVFKVAQNDSLAQASFREFAMPLTMQSLAGYVALTGESLNIPDAHDLPPHVPYQLDSSFDRDFSYYTRSVLVLPMQDQDGEVIGVVQLLNRKAKHDAIITPENAATVTKPYSDREERILSSLACQAAISIERSLLQESIENLFEGFVKASIQAVEARDTSTFGHSERVAELSLRLSQEVNKVATGSLAEITFSDRKLQEIRYAAILHDFGKIAVPEAILNKAHKLYPQQLELIGQRFSLAKRTLEMEYAEKKVEYLLDNCPLVAEEFTTQLTAWQQQLQQEIAQLDHYWQLIKNINEPDKLKQRKFSALSPENLQQLTNISNYQYKDIDGHLKPLLTDLEVEQLVVARGNLTSKERSAIEAHVTNSYEFLRRIPWTKYFQDIPDIAHRHHERLDGTGYPQGLTEKDIPLETQILSIADVFDALTGDRPYKSAFPVDVALKILRQEAASYHLNPQLVKLFEERKVYQVVGLSL
ncbi:MAG: HD domain-containing phosphohydrolase [Spirulinaceae cyanobacterium]